MKAVVVNHFGGAEVIEYVDVPDPVLQGEEILIEVEAAGVNFADLMMRYGVYTGGPKPPFIPGLEVAGTVSATARKEDASLIGQKVMALLPSGGYAQRIKSAAHTVLPLPPHFTMEKGAAFPVTYLTAYHALVTYGRMQPGETVLIHAAGGGVGTAAIQIAQTMGIRIIATVGSDEKRERVQRMGVEQVINYTEEDFVSIVNQATGGEGVQVIMESVGGDIFRKSFKCLATMGKMVVYGISSGDLEIAHPRELLFRNHSLIGLHIMSLAQRPDTAAPARRDLTKWILEGRLDPVVGKTFPLSRTAEAHTYLESRKSFGKIVLLPQERELVD